MTLGHSWSLHIMIPMRVLNIILGVYDVYISLRLNQMNNVKYKRTNEAYSVFAKEGPRVEVPYVGPTLEMSYAISTIPKSRIYQMYYIYKMKIMEINGIINREFLMNGNEYIV